jgi:Flp pilus assembly protein TadD
VARTTGQRPWPEQDLHTQIIFKNPHDPAEGFEGILDHTEANCARDGFGDFSRGHIVVGNNLVPTLEFDREQDGGRWSCRLYFYVSGTVYYALGFGSTNRDAVSENWDRIAASFEIIDTPLGLSDRSGQDAARPSRPTSANDRTGARNLVSVFALLLAVLLSWPVAAFAQGMVDFGGIGGAAVSADMAEAGGIGKPRGFKESTPTVTGSGPPGYNAEEEYSNGLTDLEFGCFMQAREDFRHVLSVQPKNARAWFLMGVAYNSSGDRGGAAGAYDKALKTDPQMIDAMRELAVSLALGGQTDKAQVVLLSLKARAAGCSGCADAELLKTSVARAEAALSGQLAEVMRPEATSAVCTAIATKAARNCFASAKFGDPHGNGVDDCTTAIASGLPDEVKTRVLVDRGVVRLFHTQAAHAIEDFDKALAMNDRIADAYTNRGAAQMSLKQFEQARADIDKGLAIGSAEPQRAYYNRSGNVSSPPRCRCRTAPAAAPKTGGHEPVGAGRPDRGDIPTDPII